MQNVQDTHTINKNLCSIQGGESVITVKSTKWTPELVGILHNLLKEDHGEALQNIEDIVSKENPNKRKNDQSPR